MVAIRCPRCSDCNNAFAYLEHRTKPLLEALERHEALTVANYILLLDWLDKVRIGIWLARHVIESHPIPITPNFHIAARIAQKDRMVAVYTFEGTNRGINLFGNDSLISSSMPSCFGLRFNNTPLLNASTDFLCSKGCCLPYPENMKLIHGGPYDGKMRLDGFKTSPGHSHPITDLKLPKPVIWLYQPIRQPEHGTDSTPTPGPLFRQYSHRIEILGHPDAPIEFDEVVGDDCATAGAITAAVYETQLALFERIEDEWQGEGRPNEFDLAYRAMKISSTREFVESYKATGDGPK